MLLRVAPKIEGRRGSQRRLCEGGRYLGIPRNRGLAALREGSGCADDHGRVFLTVQETGCGTYTVVGICAASMAPFSS
jgi:hypothetical protein